MTHGLPVQGFDEFGKVHFDVSKTPWAGIEPSSSHSPISFPEKITTGRKVWPKASGSQTLER